MPLPKRVFSTDAFEALCSVGCAVEEICAYFNTTDKTLNGWCKKNYQMSTGGALKHFRLHTTVSLRRKQVEVAMNGNVSMLIHLGKAWCGQSEKPEPTREDSPVITDDIS